MPPEARGFVTYFTARRNRSGRRIVSQRAARKGDDPLTLHETIAYEWLGQGGKRSRPFITLAAYDALQGAPATRSARSSFRPASFRLPIRRGNIWPMSWAGWRRRNACVARVIPAGLWSVSGKGLPPWP